MADRTMRVADAAVFDRVIVSPSVGMFQSQDLGVDLQGP
jgi:hypothetical protein